MDPAAVATPALGELESTCLSRCIFGRKSGSHDLGTLFICKALFHLDFRDITIDEVLVSGFHGLLELVPIRFGADEAVMDRKRGYTLDSQSQHDMLGDPGIEILQLSANSRMEMFLDLPMFFNKALGEILNVLVP